MIQPYSSEAVFAALFSLLSQATVGGSPAFVTSSRRLPAIANVSPSQQPALYMLQGEEDITENHIGLPVYQFHVAVIVLFQSTASPTVLASPQMNALRDAVINQLESFTLDANGNVVPKQIGERQTLGGIVYHVFIEGKMLKNEGLQTQQGAIVFPVKVLTGL